MKHCPHNRTRCIHGDEIMARMKIYLRWWKAAVIHRQACLDCGASLDRPAICTATKNPYIHLWTGPWTIN